MMKMKRRILIIIAEIIEFIDYFAHLEGQRNSAEYKRYDFGWLRRKWNVE